MDDAYPARFSVDYPDRALKRASTGLRIFAMIPIAIVLGTIGGYTWSYGFFLSIAAVLAAIGAWFAILFTGRYPRGIFAQWPR